MHLHTKFRNDGESLFCNIAQLIKNIFPNVQYFYHLYSKYRKQSYLRQIQSLKYYKIFMQFKNTNIRIGAHNCQFHQGLLSCYISYNVTVLYIRV